jgi:hypothetical protein
LIATAHRPAQKRDIVTINGVGPEQPRGSHTGKNVEISDAKHHFRTPIDQRRPRISRSPQRERQRIGWRSSRRRLDLIDIGLAHPPRDRPDMRRARRNNPDINRRS